MRHQYFALLGTLALVIMVMPLVPVSVSSQEPVRTPWGEPDLQGIWNNTVVVPLERAEEFGTRGELTAEEIAEIEQELLEISKGAGRDSQEGRGTEVDVARDTALDRRPAEDQQRSGESGIRGRVSRGQLWHDRYARQHPRLGAGFCRGSRSRPSHPG